ncbi:hypothetical protein APHAL10511_007346 [Amanita phalloides]|nr:hypothetical protein APHAL10511_007346 [Amanita phalloides]
MRLGCTPNQEPRLAPDSQKIPSIAYVLKFAKSPPNWAPPKPAHGPSDTNPGHTVVANPPELPPANTDKFEDLTEKFIDHTLSGLILELPPESWYRTPSAISRNEFQMARNKMFTNGFAITKNGLFVLLPIDTVVKISRKHEIKVPPGTNIRVLNVPEKDRKRILDHCMDSYPERFQEFKVKFKKTPQARSVYIHRCFDINLWHVDGTLIKVELF